MLSIESLSFHLGGRLLFDGANARLPAGGRIGLVGRNGAGKTTLLRLIMGGHSADSGKLTVRRAARIGTVAQEAPRGTASLIATVLAADIERERLLAEADSATAAADIARIHERLADIDAHTAPARAARILAGLGFGEAAQDRPIDEFSGGWRARVALAAALFAQPDLLLLDEPTNHLDLEATIWLEGFLAAWPRTLLIVSHDRDLLNKAVSGILHLEDGRLTHYQGGYDAFERVRRERLAQSAALAKRQEAERKHIQAFVDRFRYKATKARQAQSRLKMLARMQPIAAAAEDSSVSFDFPAPRAMPPPLIVLDGAAAGYEPDKPVLAGLDLRIDMDDRIALLGANGNGKTTLLRLLAGRMETQAGRIRRPGKLKCGYFAQNLLEELPETETAFRHMASLLAGTPEAKVRAHLGRFGLAQAKGDTRIADLSGGEKARLLLACITREAPQILLLDEPTNHLDVDAREALVQALNAYDGAVILVSHDPHLIGLVADRLWLVAGGKCQPYDGDLEDYRRLLLERRRAERRRRRDAVGATEAPPSRQQKRRDRAEARAALSDLRKQVKQAEATLARLTRQKQEIHEQLADPALYDGPTAAVAELTRRAGEIDSAVAEAEAAWLAVQERLEAEN